MLQTHVYIVEENMNIYSQNCNSLVLSHVSKLHLEYILFPVKLFLWRIFQEKNWGFRNLMYELTHTHTYSHT